MSEREPRGDGESVSEKLVQLRKDLKFIISRDGGKKLCEELAVKLGEDEIRNLNEEMIDDFEEDEAEALKEAFDELMQEKNEQFEKETTDKLMSMSFAAFFAVIEKFEADHPDCVKLEGYSRDQIEKFVHENSKGGANPALIDFVLRTTGADDEVRRVARDAE